VQFTGNKKMMGPFATPIWVKALAWPVCLVIAALNVYLLYQTVIAFFGA
jgi:manganese transport protein